MAALGLMLVEGEGVARDRATGVAWLRKAAERGNVRAREAMADVLARRHIWT
jgi:TPR repeat protein